ncbi:MAG TPA: hypothetical protein VGS07_28915 [Thermoanaerobaculia bacterium]|jgi:hypothetical protein|nr:hypothetical protein [Thermoanaerobaculia bacterium]
MLDARPYVIFRLSNQDPVVKIFYVFFVKCPYIYLRNELRYKSKGRRASREVKELLRQRGFSYRSVEIWMGLTEPPGLCCPIFFRDDAELARFQTAGHLSAVTELFRSALARTGYPPAAAAVVDVSAHSDETVKHSGGYYRYFN